MDIKKIKNIGIYAHVDAGKTTITEHLLYRAGVIRTIGRVDDGNTQTDSMELEKQRGISIKAAPVSFMMDDTKINIIDTPGHADFIAEVERSMNVLDGTILVISAREGVQSHTSLLFDALRKLKIPTLIFVNKIDRMGVDIYDLLNDIQTNLSHNILPIQKVYREGEKDCSVDNVFTYHEETVLEFLADHVEALLENYINNKKVDSNELNKQIMRLTKEGNICPILYGSALNGIGMEELMEGIRLFLPAYVHEGEDKKEPSGIVFKIQRNGANEKQTYVRLYNGELHVRDYIKTSKITKIGGIISGKEKSVSVLSKGDIGILYGVDCLKVGQHFGEVKEHHEMEWSTPTLKVGIQPDNPARRKELLNALLIISEEDPFLQYEISEIEQDIYINIFGDIQMEILRERLKNEFRLLTHFEDPITIYKETPIGIGEAAMYMYARNHPYVATVGLRVEPNQRGKGIEYRSEVTTGFLPKGFQNGIEDGIWYSITQGLKGWELTDIIITLIKGEFNSVESTPADFRDVTPMVLLEAVNNAGTKLLWPMYSFRLKVPKEVLGKALSDLMCRKAEFDKPEPSGRFFVINGIIPVEYCRKYDLEVIGYTEGKGSFITKFDNYSDAPKEIEACRVKTKVDPLNKGQYILSKRRIM